MFTLKKLSSVSFLSKSYLSYLKSYVFINIPTLSILKLFMQANDVEKRVLMNDKICPFSHLRF